MIYPSIEFNARGLPLSRLSLCPLAARLVAVLYIFFNIRGLSSGQARGPFRARAPSLVESGTAAMGADTFVYDADHRVVIRRLCRTCLVPKAASWASHLRAEPHWMRGDELKATIELLWTYDLRPTEELRQWTPDRTKPCRPLENLATFAGYRCVCAEDCDFCTHRRAKVHDHMPRHGKRASQHHEGPPLWRECRMQTYFTATNLRDYFVVEAPDKGAEAAGGGLPTPPPSPEEGRLFSWLRDDMQKAARHLEGKAAVVEDAGTARADRQLWLRETGFALHLRGLSDAEIKSSYKLPPAAAGRGPAGPGASDLTHILAAADSLLRDAYGLCSDRSLGRKMTQQRALRLSDFAPGAPAQSKKMVAFRSFKNESTLTTYFRRMKQLLVYYYRVVYLDDGHFTRQGEGQTVPRDVIQPSERQVQAMDEIMDSLEERDETTRAARLKRAVIYCKTIWP